MSSRHRVGEAPLVLDDDRPTDLSRRPTTAELPPVLCVEELATLLRVNRKTAYEAIASGRLPGVRRIGRTIRIDRDAVLEWLRGQGRVSRSLRRSP
jgi:excisionase family DNA binding protein